jgi:hypothetical protein
MTAPPPGTSAWEKPESATRGPADSSAGRFIFPKGLSQ